MISGSLKGSIAENMANIIFQSYTTSIQTKPYFTTNELIIQVNETDLRKSFLLDINNATRSPRRTYLGQIKQDGILS